MRDVPLGPLTTLRMGGPAARLVEARTEADVAEAVRQADARSESLLVLGGGSNVVVADRGFPGLVLRMGLAGVQVTEEPERVTIDVGAGENWDSLVARAVAQGWSGLECLSGIPGLAGATPIQNVGAYGQEVSETVTHVRAFDRESGSVVTLPSDACGFAYRHSVFKRSARWIVTGVRFVLRKDDHASVRYAELARALGVTEGAAAPSARIREAVLALRRSKGMVVDPSDPDSVSAGSFFVNPVLERGLLPVITERAGSAPPSFDAGEGRVKVPAAWLVERAGFGKGWGEGRVGVSRKHALALVNRGGGTASELLALARTIRSGVRTRFGVTLEAEPVFVGFSGNEDRLEPEEQGSSKDAGR